MQIVKWILLGVWLSCLMACSESKQTVSETPPEIVQRDDNIITFVTFNSPNTYYSNERDEYVGLEYELAKLFVKYLGDEYQLKLVIVDTFSDVLPALLKYQADIAAADISITEDREKQFDFSTSYQQVQQQLIYNRKFNKRPSSLNSLNGKRFVLAPDTSFAERIQKISHEYDSLQWEEIENSDVEQLVEALANGEIDYTIVDSHLRSLMQYYYPNIRLGFSVGDPDHIAWAFAKGHRPELQEKVNAFFKEIKANGTLNNLIDRYHGNTKRLKPFDVKTFLARSKTRLPKFQALFKNAQERTGVDWRLLAALSYQESHWDPLNTSPTNVRGLMMLTEETSRMMKVTDRLDPKQSIRAGAKYLQWTKSRFPDRIPEPDRTFMALAAYNIGFGHVEDARVLTQRLGLNPDSWADVKQSLIKLRKPKYYNKAKHGYCRCGAPVIYTESIRSYYQILKKHAPYYELETSTTT